jgi:hypothetical protein
MSQGLAPSGETALDDGRRRKPTHAVTLAHELSDPLWTMLVAREVLFAAPGLQAAVRATDVMGRQIGKMSRIIENIAKGTRPRNTLTVPTPRQMTLGFGD